MRLMQSCTLAYNDKSHIRFLCALSNEFMVGIGIITDILKDFLSKPSAFTFGML
jgi:hypothetical protein